MTLGKTMENLVETVAILIAERVRGRLATQNGHTTRNGHSDLAYIACPVPGCGKPGFGPRNRYFCQEHSKSLSEGAKNKILAERRDTKTVTVITVKKGTPAPLVQRTSPLNGAKLNMRCRASDRCFAVSKGPRFRFMCEEHLKKLSVPEQRKALAQWHKDHPRSATFHMPVQIAKGV